MIELAPAFRRDQRRELNEKEMLFLKEGGIFLGHKGQFWVNFGLDKPATYYNFVKDPFKSHKNMRE